MSGLAPACFTMDDVAEAVSRSTGTEVKYRNVTPEELKADLVATGMSETVVCVLLKVEEGAANGEVYTDSGDLARLIGRASTPLAGVAANIPLVFCDALIHVAAAPAEPAQRGRRAHH